MQATFPVVTCLYLGKNYTHFTENPTYTAISSEQCQQTSVNGTHKLLLHKLLTGFLVMT